FPPRAPATRFPSTTLFRSVCLMPRRRPSSTELMPFLAVATSHIARNQLVSGSLVAWKIVPAVSETWWRQARHWILGRVLSHLPSDRKSTRLNSSHLGISYA